MTLADRASLERIRWLAQLLDARFGVPGTRIRFGLDSIAGLVPGAGDLATGAVSLYIVWQARSMGAPVMLLARMLANIGLDTVGGTIPLVGDLFDVAFKANLRNVALLEDWLARGKPRF